MNLQRHVAAIIRRHPNQADYCAERIVKLVEKNFTANNNARMPSLCDKHYPNGGCPHLKGNFCGVECEETAPVMIKSLLANIKEKKFGRY